jgi:hypothetical protein
VECKGYFRKLDIKFDTDGYTLDCAGLDVIHVYDKTTKYAQRAMRQYKDYGDVPVTTYKPLQEDESRLLQYLPKGLLDIEVPELWAMNITPSDEKSYLPAHKDGTRLCTINFYFDTHGEVTSSYRMNANKLERVGSFCASHGEAWLLNTDEIHDVKLSSPHVRKSLGFSFKTTPYEVVSRYL